MKLENKHRIRTCFISFFIQPQDPPGRRKSQIQSLQELVQHKVGDGLSRLASGLVSSMQGRRALYYCEVIELIIRPVAGVAEIGWRGGG